MGRDPNAPPRRREQRPQGERTEPRHLQFSQESWTEIDAEGTESEMAQGRESQEQFYTPLVNEAAQRRRKKERRSNRRNAPTQH